MEGRGWGSNRGVGGGMGGALQEIKSRPGVHFTGVMGIEAGVEIRSLTVSKC